MYTPVKRLLLSVFICFFTLFKNSLPTQASENFENIEARILAFEKGSSYSFDQTTPFSQSDLEAFLIRLSEYSCNQGALKKIEGISQDLSYALNYMACMLVAQDEDGCLCLTDYFINPSHGRWEYDLLREKLCILPKSLKFLGNLKEISLENSALRDIGPLRYLNNLRSLFIDNSDTFSGDVYTILPSIEPLSGLTQLVFLSLRSCGIEDISPLQHSTNLQELSLFCNRIKDTSPLIPLKALEVLVITHNPLENLEGIAHLTSLRKLILSDDSKFTWSVFNRTTNQFGPPVFEDPPSIRELGFTTGLASLRHIDLTGLQIQDLTGLEGLKLIESLYLERNNLSSVLALKDMESLRSLRIAYNALEDLSPLESLSGLTELTLCNNRIKRIDPIFYLRKLFEESSTQEKNGRRNWIDMVRLSNNQLTDLESFKQFQEVGAVNIRYLYLNGNLLKHIGPLSLFLGLRNLDLSDNNISDISPIGAMNCLESLELARNQISNIHPCSTLQSLRELALNGNPVDDLNALMGLTALEYLDISGTKVPDISMMWDIMSKPRANHNKKYRRINVDWTTPVADTEEKREKLLSASRGIYIDISA